jgi:hypothetical protein
MPGNSPLSVPLDQLPDGAESLPEDVSTPKQPRRAKAKAPKQRQHLKQEWQHPPLQPTTWWDLSRASRSSPPWPPA